MPTRLGLVIGTVEEKAIVGIQPKPAFLPLFEVAAAGDGRDVALFSSTSVALGFGHSEDMTTTSRRLVGVSTSLTVPMDR